MSQHCPSGRTVLTRQRFNPTIGERTVSLPCYWPGERSHHPAEHMIGLDKAREAQAEGRGDFVNRGKAFRLRERPNEKAPRDADQESRGRAISRKIAEPPPTGKLYRERDGEFIVPMGVMSQYVADANAGKQGTAVQRAVDGWRGARWTDPK